MPVTTRQLARAALAIGVLALVASTTGIAGAAKKAVVRGTPKPAASAVVAVRTPKPFKVLKLGRNAKFPSSAIPKVAAAKDADTVGGRDPETLVDGCAPTATDLGTWCLLSSPYPLAMEEIGKNTYAFATQKCVEMGGYLPTAAQLIGAAARVKLSSTIDDSPLTAAIDLDATDGLKDRREMSGTLVTTQAGSSAAGSQGVSDGAKGDPKQGEPDPTPLPAVPAPDSLQYVTVYDNRDAGGFAGSRPVSQPEAFRCAFAKTQGQSAEGDG